MSRSRNRACKRRRRLKNEIREVLRQAREYGERMAIRQAQAARSQRLLPKPRFDNGPLYCLLRDLERSGVCVWRLAKDIDCNEDEMAMIAQVVAPHLAGMTPGNILRRPDTLPKGRRPGCA